MPSSSEAPLLFECEGAVARIKFNRPKVLNALNVAAADALLEASRTIAGDGRIRVVVISGEGRAFMAGGDIASFRGPKEDASVRLLRLIDPLHAALEILAGLQAPVVASLNGAIAGAGLSLALAADLAIAADNAIFTLAYSKIGTSPDGSSSWSLPRVVGLRKAMEIALLSETFDANEALRLSIVNRVVPAADLAAETEKLVQRLASGPTIAYGQIKSLMRASLGRSLNEQLEAEADAFVECAVTDDFDEGASAFIDKRAPVFKGR